MTELVERMREYWDYDTGHLISEAITTIEKQQATIAKLTEHLTTVIARYDEYRADEYDVGLHGVDDAIEKARAALAQTAKGETDVRA